ncbi:MAG: hypothetical protein ACREJM_07780 [Candidatus Saccharimonadales bacterium]
MMIGSILSIFPSKAALFAAGIVGNSCPSGSFLGFKTWYYYFPASDFKGCKVIGFNFLPANGQSDILLILLAVIDDLLIAAGIVAVAFVLFGAFKYVGSQGDPEGAASAQKTIINALIGTAIAILAAVFVNFIGQKLG